MGLSLWKATNIKISRPENTFNNAVKKNCFDDVLKNIFFVPMIRILSL